MKGIARIAIWEDGLGTYWAKCLDCPWRGREYRSKDRAVAQAETHTHDEDSEGTDA